MTLCELAIGQQSDILVLGQNLVLHLKIETVCWSGFIIDTYNPSKMFPWCDSALPHVEFKNEGVQSQAYIPVVLNTHYAAWYFYVCKNLCLGYMP